MNFEELYQKAEKNAKRQERKVREVDEELEKKKRLQMERIAVERARTKMELKRKIPPAPLPKSQKETQKFVIPKKNNEISVQSDKSMSVKKSQNTTFVKQNHLQRIQGDKRQSFINNKISMEEKKQNDRNQITNKKHFIQPKQNSSLGLGGNQRPVVQNYQELLKQAAKNDASAVEQLFNEVDSTKIVPRKKPRMAADEIGITAGLRLTHSAAKEKEKELIIKAAENKALEINQQQKSKNIVNQKPAKNFSSITTSKQSMQKNPPQPQLSKSAISNDQSAQKRTAEKSQKIMTKCEAIKKLNGAAILDKNIKSKMKISFPSNKNGETNKEIDSKTNKTSCKNLFSSSPISSANSSLPQKRYLPGDIRYKGGPEQKLSATGPMKKSSISSLAPINGQNQKQLSKTTNSVTIVPKKITQSGQMKQQKVPDLPKFNEKKLQPEIKRKEEMRSKMAPKPNLMGSKPKTMNPAEIRAKMERARPPPEYNLARIKKETFDHLQMLKKQRDRRSYQSSRPNSSRKFANYSETDEDEEEEEDEYGDEDDGSDLADFIDDSMVDDLQREDLEETLRIINPRYNKERWLRRERLIDERRMDSRFKDIETEERESARLGLVEDLIEAKRGSKALS